MLAEWDISLNSIDWIAEKPLETVDDELELVLSPDLLETLDEEVWMNLFSLCTQTLAVPPSQQNIELLHASLNEVLRDSGAHEVVVRDSPTNRIIRQIGVDQSIQQLGFVRQRLS